MPNTGEQLATILSDIYASSSKSASSLTYSVQTRKAVSTEKRAAYLGKTVANTTQAVTHALVAAGLSGARGVAEASLTASGLSLLCSLPSAIDALGSLGLSKTGLSTKELYQESEGKTHAATKAFKTSLLVTGPTKHDNIARLLLNLPLAGIQDKANHDLFPLVKKTLIKQKRGDAIKFYKAWLQDSEKEKRVTASFQQAVSQYNKEDMKAPIASLGEVASLLSLLDPEKDIKQINALSSLFKKMLTDYRSQLSSDIDCASCLDESNQVLLNLMVSTYTGRADRKKVDAKNLRMGKHVLTGVGIVLSAVLAVHTAGLSLPATALLAAKISSTSVSVLSTATRIAQMVKEGHAAEEIASLLSPELIETLNQSHLAQDLLIASQKDAHAFDESLNTLFSEIQSLNRQTYHEVITLEKDPLYILLKLDKAHILEDVLADNRFMDSLNTKISDKMQPAEIYRLMINEVSRINALPGTHAFTLKRAKLDIVNVAISYLMHPDSLTRGTLLSCAQKDESQQFFKGTFETYRERANTLHEQKDTLDEKINLITALEKQVDSERRLCHMSIGLYNHQKTPESPTAKLLKANQYIDAIEDSREKIIQSMEETKGLLNELESSATMDTDNALSTTV